MGHKKFDYQNNFVIILAVAVGLIAYTAGLMINNSTQIKPSPAVRTTANVPTVEESLPHLEEVPEGIRVCAIPFFTSKGVPFLLRHDYVEVGGCGATVWRSQGQWYGVLHHQPLEEQRTGYDRIGDNYPLLFVNGGK